MLIVRKTSNLIFDTRFDYGLTAGAGWITPGNWSHLVQNVGQEQHFTGRAKLFFISDLLTTIMFYSSLQRNQVLKLKLKL